MCFQPSVWPSPETRRTPCHKENSRLLPLDTRITALWLLSYHKYFFAMSWTHLVGAGSQRSYCVIIEPRVATQRRWAEPSNCPRALCLCSRSTAVFSMHRDQISLPSFYYPPQIKYSWWSKGQDCKCHHLSDQLAIEEFSFVCVHDDCACDCGPNVVVGSTGKKTDQRLAGWCWSRAFSLCVVALTSLYYCKFNTICLLRFAWLHHLHPTSVSLSLCLSILRASLNWSFVLLSVLGEFIFLF